VKSISEVLQLSAKFLEDRGVDRSRRMAEELLAWILKSKRLDLYMQFDRPVDEAELSLLREPLKRCAKGEPLEYIFGEVIFSDCKIFVDKRVLIPRPETEILVEKIKQMAKGSVIWDICTGSGCIGIALKKALGSSVTLIDFSAEALDVARRNAVENCVDVEILEGDLLEPLKGRKADVVVCNPPYISKGELLTLSPSVRDFEPMAALDGGGTGLLFYERLAASLPAYLNAGAQVFLEIGSGQGELVKKIFLEGPWQKMRLEKDWAGHDRFFFLEMQ
jgi:release factor glutamine methyltransferase